MSAQLEHDRITDGTLRPAIVCQKLLLALGASDGRRRKRKRTTTPDAIGMAIKRDLLERTVRDDPDPETFEEWLLEQCLMTGMSGGPVRAMALEVLDEWRIAVLSPEFRSWLDDGAPSDDAQD